MWPARIGLQRKDSTMARRKVMSDNDTVSLAGGKQSTSAVVAAGVLGRKA